MDLNREKVEMIFKNADNLMADVDDDLLKRIYRLAKRAYKEDRTDLSSILMEVCAWETCGLSNRLAGVIIAFTQMSGVME